MYPSIAKSYKGVYPFRLATTSFIYPDHYVPNVKMLGPYVDEIELLLFESLPPGSLPSEAVIKELCRLARDYDLTYNVHLPTDVSISHSMPEKQRQAVDTLLKVIQLVAPLYPSACTLHIPCHANSTGGDNLKSWQARVRRNLDQILVSGISPQLIAVETLDYPFDRLAGIVEDLKLSVCLDLGHLAAGAFDIKTIFKRYGSKTSIIHLHGFKRDRDHLAIDQLPAECLQAVLWVLQRFEGTVSLEVFSYDDLNVSLRFLDNVYNGSFSEER